MRWGSRAKKKRPDAYASSLCENNPGSDLLSHAVTHAVPSAVEGLTSVFGMGTGVTPLLCPPGKVPAARAAVGVSGVCLGCRLRSGEGDDAFRGAGCRVDAGRG